MRYLRWYLRSISANQALRLARLWRRLAEFQLAALANADSLRETLKLSAAAYPKMLPSGWRRFIRRKDLLIRAGRAAITWMNLPGIDDRNPDGFFSLPACGASKPRARPSSACPSVGAGTLITGWAAFWPRLMADYLDA
jgi:hypothetical protein